MINIYFSIFITLCLCVSPLFAAEDGFVASGEEIVRRYRVALVIEDSPVIATRSENKRSSDIVKSIVRAATIEEAVSIFAKHFDYTAQRKGVIIEFRKRFTRDEDLPCVTIGELKAALYDVSNVIGKFNPKYNLSKDPRAKSLIGSLLSLPAEKLGNGLPISEFEPGIRSEFLNVCLFFYMEPSSGCINDSIQQLKIFSDNQTYFGIFNYHEQTVFGYKGLIVNEESSASVSVPLSMPKRFIWQGNSQLITEVTRSSSTGESSSSDAASSENDDDPTEPDSVVKAAQAKTIQEILTNLVSRLAPNTNGLLKSEPRYQINPFLANKKVSLFGADYAAPDDIVQSVAAIYGLRVVKQGNPVTTLSLQRPRFRPATDALQLNKTILALMPAPMARKIRAFDEKPATEPQATVSAATNGVEASWRNAAVKRLRSIVEPMIAKKKEAKMLAQGELTGDADLALANVVMAAMYQGFYLLCRPDVPLYLTRFDDLIVSGHRVRRNDGVNRLAVRFSLRQSNGTVVPAAVFSVNTDFMGLTTQDGAVNAPQ